MTAKSAAEGCSIIQPVSRALSSANSLATFLPLLKGKGQESGEPPLLVFVITVITNASYEDQFEQCHAENGGVYFWLLVLKALSSLSFAGLKKKNL